MRVGGDLWKRANQTRAADNGRFRKSKLRKKARKEAFSPLFNSSLLCQRKDRWIVFVHKLLVISGVLRDSSFSSRELGGWSLSAGHAYRDGGFGRWKGFLRDFLPFEERIGVGFFVGFAFRFDVLCWREQSLNGFGSSAICLLSLAVIRRADAFWNGRLSLFQEVGRRRQLSPLTRGMRMAYYAAF